MDVPVELRERELILQLIAKYGLQDMEFLDVGCGDGMNIEAFCSIGMKGTGIDVSKQAIDAARSKNLQNVRFIVGDVMECVFTGQGLIFLLNVLEHIDDDIGFLKKISSILADGGHLFLAVPARSGAYAYADKNAGHYRRYDRSDLVQKLGQAGFTVRECLSVGFPVCNAYTWLFNAYCTLRCKKDVPMDTEKTFVSGIRGMPGYYPRFVQRISTIAFPILSMLIKMDRFFLSTDLGNNYVLLCQKEQKLSGEYGASAEEE